MVLTAVVLNRTWHYVRSRSGKWHRVIVENNATFSTERCNLDDSKIRSTQMFEPPENEPRCKWCYR